MAISKKVFSAIQRVLHNRTFLVGVNATWQYIHDEMGIGNISGRKLLLTAEDHEKLHSWVSLETSADPMTTKIVGDRLEAASLVRDEKWATKTVFSGMIQVNKLSGEIPLAQGNAATPPGTLLSVTAHDININNIDTIVLVENGIVARYWNKCLIPDELSTALMVYRGHSSDAEEAIKWVDSLPAKVRKIGYFDFDPAGLGMSIDYEMDAILIPDPLKDLLLEGINNKPEAYDEQIKRRPEFGNNLTGPCREVWDWMTSNGRRCAITQERLTVLEWPLRILDIR